jgi:phosphodiesterase/alkaline phosphatase D-like protein
MSARKPIRRVLAGLGGLGLTLALVCTPALALEVLTGAPSVQGGSISSDGTVQAPSVTLEGAVYPEEKQVTACEFEYGTSETYGASVACAPPPGSGSGADAVTAQLTGLDPNTLYHYRLNSENAEGAVDGQDATFTTPPATLIGVGSASVGAASVTLSEDVDPEGVQVSSCEFEYGVGETYGSSTPCTPAPGAGKAVVTVGATLTGLSSGRLYHYRLRTESSAGNVESTPGTFVTAPTVVGAVLVSNVTSFAVTLTGAIDPGIELFTPFYHFSYGASTAYGSLAPDVDLGATANHQGTVTQTLAALQPATTYHVQLVATNAGGGVVTGPDQAFTTRPLVPPAVTTGGAQALTQTGATLTGAVNPEGLSTSYRFEYGPTTGYGSIWPTVQVFAGTGSASENVAVEIPGLASASLYHYRLVASNEDGATYGADQTFATPGYPSSAIVEAPVLKTPLGIDPEARSVAKGKHRKKTRARKKKVHKRKAARRR